MLCRAIKRTYEDDMFWDILVDQSTARSGPFDGGCLICAKAMMLCVDGVELVRITSTLSGGQTEHYGVSYKEKIYDFAGVAHSPAKWLERFRREENIYDRELGFAVGFDLNSEIPDDVRAAKLISQIITKYL